MTPRLESTSLENEGRVLSMRWSDQQVSRFHSVWLRDNAPDSQTRSAENGQRLITLQDIPGSTYIAGVEQKYNRVSVVFAPENKSVDYSADWLYAHRYDRDGNDVDGYNRLPADTQTFDASLSLQKVTFQYQDVINDEDYCRQWLKAIASFGFARLQGGPVESGALFKLVDLFGYVRETNYGRHFEVRSEANPSNLAYTSLGLQAHTDNPYRDPVPGLQLLYCLDNSAEGGESQVIDGYHAALLLLQADSEAFRLLSEYSARFEYREKSGTCLSASAPMIELASTGMLHTIRFNNRSAAAFTDVAFDDMENYYEAYRMFGDIISDKKNHVEFAMQPGDSFVVDNTRVLHARSAFSMRDGQGSRWLQGCYADRDGLMSKLAQLAPLQPGAIGGEAQ